MSPERIMAPEDPKKRKACQSCTKAKAKCSPSGDRLDICYRCQRLKRECVFDETVRKRGPKNRSRVKQLEQRVETLIDMLANGQTSNLSPNAVINVEPEASRAISGASFATPPESAADSESGNLSSEQYEPTPAKEWDLAPVRDETYASYDPVTAGLLDDFTAETIIQDYKAFCITHFPFVVLPRSMGAKELRQSQPFLFHAILTATAHKHSGLQAKLAAAFQEQIACRIIKSAHKTLEILQGLLVFAGWYHFYYDPVKQQLAMILQLCVALVQDLNFSKNPQGSKKRQAVDKAASVPCSPQALAEKRAFLGTFYLAAQFSQAWRKRATLTHTRYMDQCCQQLAECQEFPSDAAITPFVQLGALMSRVSNYFSYDDVENSEIRGETLLQMSITNFKNEIDRLADTIPTTILDDNPTLRLSILLLHIWILECSVHGSLWNVSAGSSPGHMSPSRLNALFRCMNTVQVYLKAVIAIPVESIQFLAFPSWSGWCYACILACRMVFLEDEREQHTELTETFTEVLRLVMDKSLHMEPRLYSLPAQPTSSAWDPIAVANETNILSLFHQMYDKMKFTLPADLNIAKYDHCNTHPLCKIAYFQRNFLVSFGMRLKKCMGKIDVTNKTNDTPQESVAVATWENWAAPQPSYARERQERYRVPLMQNLHFNSMNFESIAPPDGAMPLDTSFSDWLWNSAMDDFTMPPL